MVYKWFLLGLFFAQSTVQAIYNPVKNWNRPQETTLLNSISGWGSSTGLHDAIKNCRSDNHQTDRLIACLNRNVAELELNAYDSQARTPLMLALQTGNAKLAQWLVHHDKHHYAGNERFHIWKKAVEGYIHNGGDIQLLKTVHREELKLQSFKDEHGLREAVDIQNTFTHRINSTSFPSKEHACIIVQNAIAQTGLLQTLVHYVTGKN